MFRAERTAPSVSSSQSRVGGQRSGNAGMISSATQRRWSRCSSSERVGGVGIDVHVTPTSSQVSDGVDRGLGAGWDIGAAEVTVERSVLLVDRERGERQRHVERSRALGEAWLSRT